MALELNTFSPGGIHAPECKELTENLPIADAQLPSEVILPLSQHAGAPAKPIVEVGQEVKVGQKIAEAPSLISAPIHASVSGKIKAIEKRQTVTGKPVESILITPSEEQNEPEIINRNVDDLSPEQIVEIVREAGVVGLGGAAFPTHVKLSPPKDSKIEYVIINGCECEPYLTCDHRMMLEESDELIAGTKLLLKTVGAQKAFIGIEVNKMNAIELIAEKTKNISDIEVVGVQARYPQGAERQLIQAILKREVPIGGLPSSVGALVQNVGTTISIYKACAFGRPLIDRVVTVSGKSINEPKNLRVRLGSPVQEIINQCGGLKDDVAKIIVGGPMTGFGVFDLSIPVVKGTSGILALSKDEVTVEEVKACVRCGKCVQNCPMGVEPFLVTANVEAGFIDEALDLGLMNCCECGICAYVCPSNRPLVQMFKFGKSLTASGKG